MAVALLLVCLLLVAQTADRHGALPLPFLLVPVFLFGLVGCVRSLRPTVAAGDGELPAPPRRAKEFQRPPPSFAID